MCCSEVYFDTAGKRKKSEALRAVRPSRPQPNDMSRLGESYLNKEPTGPQNKTFGHRGPIARRPIAFDPMSSFRTVLQVPTFVARPQIAG